MKVLRFNDWQQIVRRLPAPPPDAYPEGARVSRSAYRDGGSDNAHAEGDLGYVRLRVYAPEVGLAYIVEWDDTPGVPVLVIAKKLERVNYVS